MAEELVSGDIFEETYQLKERRVATDLKQKWLVNELETGRTLALTLLNTKMSPERYPRPTKGLAKPEV